MELFLNERQESAVWHARVPFSDADLKADVYDACSQILNLAQELSGEYRMPMTNLIPLVTTMMLNEQKRYEYDIDFERKKVLLELELENK